VDRIHDNTVQNTIDDIILSDFDDMFRDFMIEHNDGLNNLLFQLKCINPQKYKKFNVKELFEYMLQDDTWPTEAKNQEQYEDNKNDLIKAIKNLSPHDLESLIRFMEFSFK
jgi:hypothetical protein